MFSSAIWNKWAQESDEHEKIFQRLTKLHETVGRVQFVVFEKFTCKIWKFPRFCCRFRLTVFRWVWEIPRTPCRIYLRRTERRAENTSSFTAFFWATFSTWCSNQNNKILSLKATKRLLSAEENIRVQLRISAWVQYLNQYLKICKIQNWTDYQQSADDEG